MRSFFLILLTLVLSNSTFAQKRVVTAKVKNIKALKSRPLKVVLLKDNNKSNIQFNTYLKQAINSEYDFNQDITFIKPKDFKNDKKSKVSNYAYLEAGQVVQAGVHGRSSFRGLKYLALDNKGKEIVADIFVFDLNKKNLASDYFIRIRSIQYNLDFYNYQTLDNDGYIKPKNFKRIPEESTDEERFNMLKNMTLYIDRDMMKKDIISSFGSYYKFPFKIVNKSAIDEAIVSNNKTIAILEGNIISSADTGKGLLNFYEPINSKTIVAPFGIGTGIFSSKKLKKEDLEKLATYFK